MNICPGISLAGTREHFIQYLLDGVDDNNVTVQTYAFRPSVDMIQEFKVAYNTFGAESGRSSGSQVSVVTKSGTNEFHGNVFGFLRNAAFDARNFFDSKKDPIPPFRRGQFGATVGGPIVKDRTFFFVNYEGLRLFQAITSVPSTIPAAYRAGGFLRSGHARSHRCEGPSLQVSSHTRTCHPLMISRPT